MLFVRWKTEILNSHFMQLMSQNLTSTHPAPHDQMSSKAHVINLTGSNQSSAWRYIDYRDVVSVTRQELLLVCLETQDGNLISNCKDQMLLVRMNSQWIFAIESENLNNWQVLDFRCAQLVVRLEIVFHCWTMRWKNFKKYLQTRKLFLREFKSVWKIKQAQDARQQKCKSFHGDSNLMCNSGGSFYSTVFSEIIIFR